MWRIGRAPDSIPIYSYIQQNATSHILSISGNCSTCFGWYFHSSSGAYTTVSIESGICHTVTAICRFRGRVGTGLSVLWVAYCVRGRAGGRVGLPARPRTQHDTHHDTNVKPEAATAVIELLMMGGKTPETCWAVNKRQDNKLKNVCIRLVTYLN
jgi:hypothetical protein